MRPLHYLFIAALLYCCGKCLAQPGNIKDSLFAVANSDKRDSSRVEALLKYGELFVIDNPDSAMFYFNKAVSFSKEIGFLKGEAYASSYILPVLNNKGKFKEALKVAMDALEIYKKIGSNKDLSSGYINVGSEWEYFSEYKLAVDNYLKALAYATAAKHDRNLRIINNNLASAYISVKEYVKGKKYAETAYQLAVKLKNDYAKASSLINIATADNFLKQHTAALKGFEQVEALGTTMEDSIIILDSYVGKGDSYIFLNDKESAKKHFEKAIQLSKSISAPEYELYATVGMGKVLKLENKLPEAFSYFNNGATIAKELGTKNELQNALFECAAVQEQMGNGMEAVKYYKESQIWKDSVFVENNNLQISVLDIKYETEKRETQIQLQSAVIKQKITLNYLFGGGAAALALISFFGYRNYRHKQSADKLRIQELETEKQLAATEAVLKGEEQERTRLAKDLHDGLGGMLSGIKYSFNNMKENLILTPDMAQAFSRSMDMLDNSIQEMRRVAHNMMPEPLLRYGLHKTLQDYVTDVNKNGVTKIVYQGVNIEALQLDNSTAVTIYRIVQELINNTLKHAAAKNMLVQLLASANGLVLNVEDDGKGFDTKIIELTNGGIGWKNIKSRVDLLKGSLKVESAKGSGTQVNIELTVLDKK